MLTVWSAVFLSSLSRFITSLKYEGYLILYPSLICNVLPSSRTYYEADMKAAHLVERVRPKNICWQ